LFCLLKQIISRCR